MRTAVIRRPLYLPLLCFALLAGTLPGGEPDRDSPIVLHASIASLPDFIEAVDNGIARATADTSQAIQPGILAAILRAHMAIPTEGWYPDRPMHIVFLQNRPSPKNMMMVLQADSLDAFAKGMTDNNITVARESNGPGGRNTLVLATGDEENLIATDMDDGYIALASDADAISVALDQLAAGAWRLRETAADLSLFFPLPGFASPENPMLPVVEQFAHQRRAMQTELEGMGLNPLLAEALLSLAEKRLPDLGRELVSIRAVALDCRFDRETLQATMRIMAEPDSFTGRLGEALSNSMAIDGVALAAVPEKKHIACAGTALARILPDFQGQVEALTEDLGKIFPDRDESGEQPSHFESFIFLAETDWTLFGNITDEGVDGSLRLAIPMANFLPSCERLVKSLNAVLAEAVADPALRVRIIPEDVDGRAYRMAFTDPTHVDALFRLFRAGNPAFTATRESLERRRLVVGGDTEHTILTVESAHAPPDIPVAQRPAVASGDLLPYLPHRQGAVALISADWLLQALFTRMLRDLVTGMDPIHAGLHITALAKAFPTMHTTEKTVGFSLGAVDRDVAIGLALPYRVIGAALANYEIFSQTAGSHDHKGVSDF